MAFCSRTHSLYKVKVNDIFSDGYKVATKEPLSWGLCYNKDMNSNSYNYCDKLQKYLSMCSGVAYCSRGTLPIYWYLSFL